MAVGVTKAVQDRVSKALSSVLLQATFSSSIRDTMVLSIQEKVRQGYPQDVLVKRLNSFAAEVLNTITDVAVREICALFQPQTPQAVQTTSDEPPAHTAVHNVFDRSLDETEPEPDSAVVSTPSCLLTTTYDPPARTAGPEPDSAVVSCGAQAHAQTAVHNVFTKSLDETEKQPEPSPELDYTFVDDNAKASTEACGNEETCKAMFLDIALFPDSTPTSSSPARDMF
ncbi:hypothetical protein D9C73_015781 [Collichthys lucidus]|uniref:Uncharacterized protein n=1 Tax=Collichthys lucidus TaxID=240159 RepID=A0A4U5V5E0_COLLU|nr:hypothetical protein D9C73_015781 [Collichthys lucidus]